MKKFDFQKYRGLSTSRKMTLRFIIYGILILFFLYWLKNTSNSLAPEKQEVQIRLDATDIAD